MGVFVDKYYVEALKQREAAWSPEAGESWEMQKEEQDEGQSEGVRGHGDEQVVERCLAFTVAHLGRLWQRGDNISEDNTKAILVNALLSVPASHELDDVGDMTGACSRRINIQHRLVYEVLDSIRIVKVLRMWTHYE